MRPGEGSVGLGLRADRGICLRDTVRDLRGAVAIEDCFTRNLSYIGLPVFLQLENANRESPHELGARGRPIGHFGVFFPAPLGWHEPFGSSDDWCNYCTFASNCETKPICLYQQMMTLRKDVIQPFVAQNYEMLSNARYRTSVGRIAELGDDATFQDRGVEPDARRRVFLQKLLPANEESRDVLKCEPNGEQEQTTLKIEEFQAVQIWERHAAIAGLSADIISDSEALYTWRQSVRWNYPDLFLAKLRETVTEFELNSDNESLGPWDKKGNGPWCELKKDGFAMTSRRLGDQHQLILVLDKGRIGIPDLTAAIGFWKEALQAVESAEVPDDMPEFKGRVAGGIRNEDKTNGREKRSRQFDRIVRTLKWRRMLRGHLAQCLVGCLVRGQAKTRAKLPPTKISRFLFRDAKVRTRLQISLRELKPVREAMVAAILGGADYRPDWGSIKPGRKLKPLEERLRFELEHVGHSLSVILDLAHAARSQGAGTLKDGNTARFRTNHTQEPGHGITHDWPIQSEAYITAKETVAGLPESNSHIDCGAETAFSIPAIWRAWWKEFGERNRPNAELHNHPPELDLIEFRANPAQRRNIDVTLRHAHGRPDDAAAMQFTLLENSKAMEFHSVLAFRAEPLVAKTRHLWDSGEREKGADSSKHFRIWRLKEPKDKTTVEAAGKIAAFLADCACCTECGPGKLSADAFYLVVARLADRWMIERRSFAAHPGNPREPDSPGCCTKVLGQSGLLPAFEHILASAGDDAHLLGPDFGLTTHVCVPLRRPTEQDQNQGDVGFMVLSGSQTEHDTIRRVDIRLAQRALAQFAADYLEYAVYQELQTEDMRESLQGFAHSLRRRASFLRLGSLAAFAPGIRTLLSQHGLERLAEIAHFQSEPWIHTLAGHLDALLDDLPQLEILKRDNVDFNILIEALTTVLAGKPEQPFRPEAAAKFDHLRSVEDWLCFVVNKACRHEEGRHKHCRFQPHLPASHSIPAADAPLGSWAIVIEEVIRNAAKHGRPKKPRILNLRVNKETISLNCCNAKKGKKNKEDKALGAPPELASTHAGIREIKKHLQTNYGARAPDTWTLTVDESSHYSITIEAHHAAYRGRLHEYQ